MPSHVRGFEVSRFRIMVMKVLKQQTLNDETVSINKHSIFEMACRNASSLDDPGPSDNAILKSLVFEDLLKRGDIREGDLDAIRITFQGKTRQEYC